VRTSVSRWRPPESPGLLAAVQSADIVLPTTDGRVVLLRRVTARAPKQNIVLELFGTTKPKDVTCGADRLPRNVWVLSWVAFFNDTATEMSYWLLPQFLVGVLGAGPMAFGLIEGAAETVSSFGRVLSGWLSDRMRRRKPLVAIGYFEHKTWACVPL
jgi:hypothetical protein